MSGEIDSTDEMMEVYIYQGNEGEQVPGTVEKLIVDECVQELPDDFCYNCERLLHATLPNGLIKIGAYAFAYCGNLLEIKISGPVQVIGESAFIGCRRLKRVEWGSSSTSLQHRLEAINYSAFAGCNCLQRVKIPSSVNAVGQLAFEGCSVLMEADLSAIAASEIPAEVFLKCASLQTVSLPNQVDRIGDGAFCLCSELVTVAVPLNSHNAITVGEESFYKCQRLSNFWLPQDSTAKEDSFHGCKMLHQQYGEDSSRIVDGLMGRFENHPTHKMLYDRSEITLQTLRQCVSEHGNNKEEALLVDEFGMTPFHIFLTTIEPSMEVLDVLLDSLPIQLLKRKDANGRRPADYLINNLADESVHLVHKTLQKSLLDPLARWGSAMWIETIRTKVQEILAEHDKDQRSALWKEAHSAFKHYENVQATSLLEMAMWKWKLQSGGNTATDVNKTSNHPQVLDREDSRCLSGSDVAIPHVTMFLIAPFSSLEEGDSSQDNSAEIEDLSESNSSED